MKHTKGPWEHGGPVIAGRNPTMYPAKREFLYVLAQGTDVCHLPIQYSKPSDEQWANARLISAAPELLEALRNLVAQVELEWRDLRLGNANDSNLRVAKLAIAKAESD